MKNRIKPTVDCVFKAILGKKENENLLINFLNAVLKKNPGERIVHVTILNPYNEREFEGAKLSIVDVKVQDESGNYYQIEVQISLYSWIVPRMLHNWAAIYHAQLEKGAEYSSLNPLISIWILDGVLFEPPDENTADTDKYRHLEFECREKSLGMRLSDHFGIHIIQLPYRNPLHTEMDDKERRISRRVKTWI
jgi:predicted transposase/invertase (TIGR01784 family)